MASLIVGLGAEVNIDNVKYAASIYFMTNWNSSQHDEDFKDKRSNDLEILEFLVIFH